MKKKKLRSRIDLSAEVGGIRAWDSNCGGSFNLPDCSLLALELFGICGGISTSFGWTNQVSPGNSSLGSNCTFLFTMAFSIASSRVVVLEAEVFIPNSFLMASSAS